MAPARAPKQRALFLDRDGVLNRSVTGEGGSLRAPWTQEEMCILPGVEIAVASAAKIGFLPIVVTNQPDVARGKLPRGVADAINAGVQNHVSSIKALYTCFHSGEDGCVCRKPLPGLLTQAAQDFELDLESSWLVGDRWVDVAAAASAGCRSVLLRHHLSWEPTSAGAPPAGLRPDAEAADLPAAVDYILRALAVRNVGPQTLE